ncbi:MAG: 16S rRNA methyltransferase [Candidatus Bathyarchaeota archaeon]|nr:MAG: 16S rRNA methyltransferase [Candidatus Bathyarchaeota archaeon]
MLHLIFVEAALEIVPTGLLGHPSIRRNAKRRKKRPEETLLNRSLHHAAMGRLPDSHKRGRPDIAHICLLEALGTPLNSEERLRVWIHTYGGYAVEVAPKTRVPRDCNRFNSLMEQIFAYGRVPLEGEPLMTLSQMTLRELVGKIGPDITVALTSHGEPSDLEKTCERLLSHKTPAVLIGAFPHGPMSDETISTADEMLSIHSGALEAWVVASRLIYEYEKAIWRR